MELFTVFTCLLLSLGGLTIGGAYALVGKGRIKLIGLFFILFGLFMLIPLLSIAPAFRPSVSTLSGRYLYRASDCTCRLTLFPNLTFQEKILVGRKTIADTGTWHLDGSVFPSVDFDHIIAIPVRGEALDVMPGGFYGANIREKGGAICFDDDNRIILQRVN